MQKFFFYIFAFTMGIMSVQAQLSNRSKSGTMGNREFDNLRYSYAIPLYKQHLKQFPADTAVLRKLGKCYQLNLLYDSAIHYLSMADALTGTYTSSPLPELYAAKGNYTKAVELYKKELANTQSLSEAQRKKISNRILGFENSELLVRDSADYQIGYLSLNSGYQEFNAVPYRNGLIFESNRSGRINSRNEFGWDGNAFTRLYYAADSNLTVTANRQTVSWFEKPVQKGLSGLTRETPNDTRIVQTLHDLRQTDNKSFPTLPVFNKSFEKFANTGAVSITTDGKTLFFTRNAKNPKGISHLEIWQSQKKQNEQWSEPIKMDLGQTGAYSVFHPAVTADGKRLYFASDMPGGYGGTDIYYIDLTTDKTAGQPQSAGPIINTAGEELFPAIYGQYLYFSSNGHAGLGGLDIYRIATVSATTAAPENLGAPVNSTADDLGYSRIGQIGYFSSNRYGSDDIFRYEYAEKKVTVSGKISLPDTIRTKVLVRLYEGRQTIHLIDTVWTDDRGAYQFQVRPNREYTIVVPETKQLTADTVYFVARNERPYAFTIPTVIARTATAISQIKLLTGMPIVSLQKKPQIDTTEKTTLQYIESLPNRKGQMFTVYHPFDKAEYRKADEAVIQSVIKLMRKRPGMWLQVISTADCKGSMEYNLGLSERRAKNVYKHLPSDLQKNTRLGWVSKVELREPCPEDKQYNVDAQWRNRYTYLFVTDTPIPDGADMVPGSANAPKLKVKGAVGGQEQLIDFTNKKNIELPKTEARKNPNSFAPQLIRVSQMVTPEGSIRQDRQIEALLNRDTQQPVFIKTRSDSVLVELYDNGVFDQDSVSVFFNKKLLAYKQVLQTNKPIRFYVKLQHAPEKNELIMVAENLGLMPPNSALMIITDADRKRNEVYVTSDLQHNSVIYIIKEK